MYEHFYGLDSNPFNGAPDPDVIFLSPQHKRALSTLEYALIARAGFCVVTGDVGAGKTTLVRRVLQTASQDIHVGLVSNGKCDSFEELLRWILLAFDLEYKDKDKVEMYEVFVNFVIAQHQKGEPVTLIIDEAQNLNMDNLEQLRMLSNINTEKGTILQTILIGQPELWDMLRNPEMSQFAQRISYEYFLPPLQDANLTKEYVQFRLQKCGGSKSLFTESCFQMIWEATRGVPRLINLLCDNALIYGFGDERAEIDATIVAQVINDRSESFEAKAPPKIKKSRLVIPKKDSTELSASHGMSIIERAMNDQKSNRSKI